MAAIAPPVLDAEILVRRSRAIGPWATDLLTRVVLADVVGVVCMAISWYQTAGQGLERDAIAWLNLGILGLVISGVAHGFWLARGRRAIGLARDGAVRRIEARAGGRPDARRNDVDTFVAGPAMTRYHRRDCAFVGGRGLSPAPRTEHEDMGLLPCEVCEP